MYKYLIMILKYPWEDYQYKAERGTENKEPLGLRAVIS